MRWQFSLTVAGLLIIALLFGGSVQGENKRVWPPAIEWERTYGGTAGDSGRGVQQTTDGGYIICGSTASYGKGGYDIWLLKTDATGTLEWSQTYGSPVGESGYVVKQTMDDGYIVVGYTGGYYPWLIKVTSTGELQWNRTYVGIQAKPPGGQQTTDGGYIIVGKRSGFWLGKTDPQGNLEWNQTLHWSGEQTPYDVKQTADGGYIVGGTNLSPYLGSYSNALAVKTDASGHLEWSYGYSGGTLSDRFSAVQQTADQGYIFAGYTYQNTKGPVLNIDFLLVKLNAYGRQQWDLAFGGDAYESAMAVDQTTDGGYILVGRTWPYWRSPGLDPPTSIWLVKTDVAGTKEWDLIINNTRTRHDDAGSIRQTSDGGYILVGSTGSNGGDIWLIKLGPDRSRIDLFIDTLKTFWWLIPVGLIIPVLLHWIRKKARVS